MRATIIEQADRYAESSGALNERLRPRAAALGQARGNAGVLLAAEAFRSSAGCGRLDVSRTRRTVTDGPFTETKEGIAGSAIGRAAKMAAAFDGEVNGDESIELRQMVDLDDFGPEFTLERREAEERSRPELAGNR